LFIFRVIFRYLSDIVAIPAIHVNKIGNLKKIGKKRKEKQKKQQKNMLFGSYRSSEKMVYL